MGLGESRNLFKPEAPSRVCVIVTNSTNTLRAYCVKRHVYGLVKVSVSSVLLQSACTFLSKLSKISGHSLTLKKLVSSSKENNTLIFFEGVTKFWITGSSRPFSRLFWNPICSFRIRKERWIRDYFEELKKMALESVQFIKTLVIKKLQLQQIESQAQHTDSSIV